jgi:hypothetical protein
LFSNRSLFQSGLDLFDAPWHGLTQADGCQAAVSFRPVTSTLDLDQLDTDQSVSTIAM